jgi:putative peptidoglycan lipid II flippase
LFYQLRKQAIYQPQPGWLVFFVKILLALAVMSIVLWFTAGNDATWLTGSALSRATQLSGVVLAGAASYFAALWLLGFRLKDFTNRQTL